MIRIAYPGEKKQVMRKKLCHEKLCVHVLRVIKDWQNTKGLKKKLKKEKTSQKNN